MPPPPRRRLGSGCSGNGHRTRVLQVGHDHGRDGEHEAAHDLEKARKVLVVTKHLIQNSVS